MKLFYFSQKLLLILSIIFINLLPAQTYHLSEIKGTILDKSTKNPIPQANIYIAYSIIGSASNENGEYAITNLSPGSYTVIVSCVGYDVCKEKIIVKENRVYKLNFQLDIKIYQLPDIVVQGEEDEDWQENFEMFFNQFIGTSTNAEKCKILNSSLIELYEQDSGQLIAKIEEPIEIENLSLGYKVLYFLDSFLYDGKSTKYNGLPVFELLDTTQKSVRNQWAANRLLTYCGSLRHFLNAASRDYDAIFTINRDDVKSNSTLLILKNEGFTVKLNQINDMSFRVFKTTQDVHTPEFIYQATDKNEKILSFPGLLQVSYNKKYEDENYNKFLNSNRPVKPPVSLIRLHSLSVNFDEQGRYYDDFQIETFGYWAFERVADMLPFDYQVSDSTLTNINLIQ